MRSQRLRFFKCLRESSSLVALAPEDIGGSEGSGSRNDASKTSSKSIASAGGSSGEVGITSSEESGKGERGEAATDEALDESRCLRERPLT